MEYNLEGKIFKSVSNTENGEVGEDTIFHYHQKGNRIWASYSGGSIIDGHLMAIKSETGQLNMSYHHINDKNQVMAGTCISTPSADNKR